MTILRCVICDWPIAERREEGCVPGDCSYRPCEGSAEWYRIKQRRADLARMVDPIKDPAYHQNHPRR
jgi:hypothetical protein